MKDKRISQSGITLIALIITIIVMLILVAVTVKISIDSGLFGHAKNATQSWADMEGKESNIGNKPVTIDGVTYNSMDEYVASLPQKTETPETPTKPDRTGLSVGDYVDYTPDKADNYMGLGTSTSEKAGSPNNLSGGIPQDKNLKWRILSINESGTVDIISDTPTATAVYLQGSIGYNNGVYLLNDLCASLYSNSTLGVKARSINLMDIENKLSDAGKNARDTYTTSKGIPYGNTQTYTGTVRTPDIYKQVGKTIEEESKDYYKEPTILTHTRESSLDVKQTMYRFSNTQASYFVDETFYNLVFGTGKYSWVATRYAECDTDSAFFGLYYLDGKHLNGYYLLHSSYDSAQFTNLAVRPIVTLGADIQISAEGGTADNPRTLGK